MIARFDATGLPRVHGKQAPFGGPEVKVKQVVGKGIQAKKRHTKGSGTKKCPGRSGQACTFGKHGQASWSSRGHRQCMWCSPDRLLEACDRRGSRGGLVKSFKNMSEEQQGRALALLPEKFQAYFVEVASKQWRCQGYNGETCVFAESDEGGKAQVNQKKLQCLFCDVELLARQCSTQTGQGKFLTRLRRMAPASRQKAVEARIPEEHRKYFQDALAVRAVGGAAAGAQRANRKRPAAAMEADWKPVLEKRQSLRSTWDEKKQKAYRVQVLDDRARVRRRFGLPGRASRGEDVTNETGLPACHLRSEASSASSCMSGASNILGACADNVTRWCLCP